jgi:hypothetical protein
MFSKLKKVKKFDFNILELIRIQFKKTMEVLNSDIMELIGREVQIVRETEQNKATFSKVVDDINTLQSVINLYEHIDFTHTDASIHPLFMTIYFRDPDETETHPFITGRMSQVPDDEQPPDYFGGITCSHHIDDDY